MSLPSTGWLATNPTSEEVLPALLPESFICQYIIGTDDFNQVLDPFPTATSIKFGSCVVTLDHGIGIDSNGNEQYGLVAKLIRKGAFGSIILDTLTVPEVTLKTIVKEVCPPPVSLTKEVCPDSAVYTIEPTLV